MRLRSLVLWLNKLEPYTSSRLENLLLMCREDKHLCVSKLSMIHFNNMNWYMMTDCYANLVSTTPS